MTRILGFALIVGLVNSCALLSLVTGGDKAVGFYAPVVSRDEKQIAYLKRTTRVKYGPEGFGGHAAMSFRLDRLELCAARLDLSGERCLEEWNLPLEKSNELAKGEIEAELAWRGSTVMYRIELEGFEWQCGEESCPRKRILSNVGQTERIERQAEGTVEATVDLDAWRYAFPISNKIIIRKRGEEGIP